MQRQARSSGQVGDVGRAGGAGMPAPGKTTLTMGLPSSAQARDAGQRAAGRAAGGLGGDSGANAGPDLTLDPAHDDERAATNGSAWVGDRPIDPEHPSDGWGSQYGDCHGIPAFRNVIDNADERTRIAALFPRATAGGTQFGLTVPTPAGNAYQCVEFVNRYYRDALGVGGIGGGNAQTYLSGGRGGLEVHRFPSPTRPQAGDLVVQESGVSSVGHVGIVESVAGGDGGALTVTVVQQNWGASSPKTTFTLTPTQTLGLQAPGGDVRPMQAYTADKDWSGFRRKAGVKPVDERGGGSASQWLDRKPDHGTGNYIVKPGETVAMYQLQQIYGLSADEIRRINPCIPDAVTATTTPIEIRVSGGFPYPEPWRFTAMVYDRGPATIFSQPSSSGRIVNVAHQAVAGTPIQIYEVVDGEAVDAGNRRWYRIAIFTNEPAYVYSGRCSGGTP